MRGVNLDSGKNPYEKFSVKNHRQYQKLLDEGYSDKEIQQGGDKYDSWREDNNKAQKIADSVNEKLKDKNNKDSASTLVMKELGFEGVDSRGTDLDNGIYGSVIYDVKKPKQDAKETKEVRKESKQEKAEKPSVGDMPKSDKTKTSQEKKEVKKPTEQVKSKPKTEQKRGKSKDRG